MCEDTEAAVLAQYCGIHRGLGSQGMEFRVCNNMQITWAVWTTGLFSHKAQMEFRTLHFFLLPALFFFPGILCKISDSG